MEQVVVMVIRHVETKAVRVPTAVAERRDELDAAGCCVACGDRVKAPSVRTRGLCSSCYQHALREIKAGRLSVEELVRKGLILPAKPAGRKPKAGGMAERLRSEG